MKTKFFALTICVLLIAACGDDGGGGSEVAVGNPDGFVDPVSVTRYDNQLTPLVPGVDGMLGGSFDAIGLSVSDWDQDTNRSLLSGELKVQVAPLVRAITLVFDRNDPGLLLPQEFTFHPWFGDHLVQTTYLSNGENYANEYDITRSSSRPVGSSQFQSSVSRAGLLEDMQLTYDLGLSHVSLGHWNRTFLVDDSPDAPYYHSSDNIFFVYGERAVQLPASGIASYQESDGMVAYQSNIPAEHIELFLVDSFWPIQLDIDFGSGQVTANGSGDLDIWTDYASGDTDCCVNLQVSGSAMLGSNGTFSISVTGWKQLDTDSEPYAQVTGVVTGALFGPNADQIGVTYQLTSDLGDGYYNTITGAFIGALAFD